MFIRKLVVGLIAFCCISVVLSFGSLQAQDKSAAGSSASAVLDSSSATAVKFDREIEQALKDWQVPGVAVAVVKDDRVLLSKGYGVRRVGESDQVDGDTLFAIASNSKAFTSAALAILVDDGKLKWDDHVSDHLPWFRLKDPAASADIRVRDLLCHRSGLGTFSGDLLWWGTPYTPKEILQRAVHLEPESAFRSEYGYSNLMFLAAGEVIEAVSGKRWPEFVSERILTPAGMSRSITTIRDLDKQGNYATPHKTLEDSSNKPIAWMNWDSMVAAGGIISSSNDMSKWLRLQLRAGESFDGKRVFSAASGHEMFQAHISMKMPMKPSARFPSTHFRAYGLGWTLSDYKGKKVVGHGGGYDGMYSQVLMVPEEKLGIVVLSNSMTSITNLLGYRGLDLWLGGDDKDWSSDNLKQFKKSREEFNQRIKKAIAPAAKDTKPSHAPDAYAGTYRCPLYGDIEVSAEGEKLVLKLLPYPDLVADLEHLHYDTFVIRWRKEFAWFDEGTILFVPDARGKFVRLVLDVPNDDLWFHELKPVRVPAK